MINMNKVIYIHPQTPMMEPLTIPLSIPALIKRISDKLNIEVRGYAHYEVNRKIINNAVVAIIDIHWFFSLKGAIELVNKIKEYNSNLIIIAGGITATLYAKKLTSEYNIDYIIRGDAEIPLPLLVEAIIFKKEVISIPNIVDKYGLETEWNYVLDAKDINENNYLDIDFFPTYKKRIKFLHYHNKVWAQQIYPYILPFRGCPNNCDICGGGNNEQYKLFRRRSQLRDSQKLVEDLDFINENKDYHFATFIWDFLCMEPVEYGFKVLNKYRDLAISYFFSSTPSMSQLQRLINSFNGGLLNFCIDKKHVTSYDIVNVDLLISLINEAKLNKKFISILNYSKIYAINDVEYYNAVNKVRKSTGVILLDTSFWWDEFPMPDNNGNGDNDKFTYFLNFNYKEKYGKQKYQYIRIILNIILDILLPIKISIIIKKSFFKIDGNMKFKTIKHKQD